MTVFAHLGADHLWASFLYLMPVVIVVAGIGFTSWRDKRRDAAEAAAKDDEAAPTTPPGSSAAP